MVSPGSNLFLTRLDYITHGLGPQARGL